MTSTNPIKKRPHPPDEKTEESGCSVILTRPLLKKRKLVLMRPKTIQGLVIVPHAVDSSLAETLWKAIYDPKSTWTNGPGSRRVQQYGKTYDYGSRSMTDASPIPNWIKDLETALRSTLKGIDFDPPLPVRSFEQIIVNEYKQGQCITKHIDHSSWFDDCILSLSLGCTGTMKFTRSLFQPETFDLEPGTLVIMRNDARWKWFHEILPIKASVGSGSWTVFACPSRFGT